MIMKCLSSGSRGNCYLLQSSEGETLILECGVDIKEIKKALNFNFSKVVGCLVTHGHNDHSKSVTKLMELGVQIYCSDGTVTEINNKFDYTALYRWNSLRDRGFYDMGNFTVIPFEVKHDAREPLGFLIDHVECGTILFATDTYYIPYNFSEFEIHHVMIECNYSKEILMYNNQLEKLKDRIMHSHFELEDVKEFFRANNFTELRDVVLLHISNANSNAKQFTEEIRTLTKKPVYVADKGLEVDFNLFEF